MRLKTNTDFITQSRTIHGDRYDYSKVDYKTCKDKICVICPEHGEFWVSPDKHLNRKQGCLKCKILAREENCYEQYLVRAREVHNNKYLYPKAQWTGWWGKVPIVCPKHGEFLQSPAAHIYQKEGCPECAKEQLSQSKIGTTTDFIQKCTVKYGIGAYDYSKVEYANSQTKVCVICPEHGEFWQRPDHFLQGHTCPLCSIPKGEKRIKEYLDSHNIEYQHDSVCFRWLGQKRLDFYIPQRNLAIEYNGIQHYEPIEFFGGKNALESLKERDTQKDHLCQEHGVRLLRIPYTDFDRIEEILEKELNN